MPAALVSRAPTLTRIAATVALALGLTPWAQAQSLTELYQTARGYDASYLAARAVAESAQYKADQAHAQRRPKLSAELAVSRTASETPVADNTAQGPNASLKASQTLFNRANDLGIQQADLGVQAAEADLQLAEQELIVRVTQAYFDVLAAQDALTTAQASKKAISEQLASAKRNFEVGTATITDTREAQARFDLSTAQEIGANNELITKRIALDQLVGRSNVQPQPLAVPVALPAVEPADAKAWVDLTDTAPNVRKARIKFDAAQLETSKARAGHLPTVELTGGISRGRSSADGVQNRVPYSYSGSTNGSSVAVTLSVPLFVGYAVQNRIKETLLLEDQSRNELEAARRTVAQATRQAFFGVQSLQAQVKALEAAESSTQLALEATQLGYKVGVRVNLDVLNAQTQLFGTRRDLARARYDVVLTHLKLRQAAGQLKPDDVDAVNRLLAK